MNNLQNLLKSQFENKKVLLVGLGLLGGGVGLAKFFAQLGAKVRVTDKKTKEQLLPSIKQLNNLTIHFTLGKHDIKDFLEADVIFKGPSVPWDLPQLKEAQKMGKPIEMESSFFAQYCPAPIIGVTGTRGKSTTTYMIYKILKNIGLSCYLAGNIPGISTINLLLKIRPTDWVVMELSSWQLAGFHQKKISPHVAVFTSFSPDHLNLYSSMSHYFYDKKAIYLYQKDKDCLIINKELKSEVEKDQIRAQIHYVSTQNLPFRLDFLKGEHNLKNATCAYEVAKILNLDLKKAADIITGFTGLPYRQEVIVVKDGIVFVNDTTSTTPTACVAAINSFSDFPIILILGGNSKNLSYDVLINRLIDTEKIILLKGSFTDQIFSRLQKKYSKKITPVFNDFQKAVKTAYQYAKKILLERKIGKVVLLLSPGATSFSMFSNEFHRGDEFNKIVKKMTKSS